MFTNKIYVKFSSNVAQYLDGVNQDYSVLYLRIKSASLKADKVMRNKNLLIFRPRKSTVEQIRSKTVHSPRKTSSESTGPPPQL